MNRNFVSNNDETLRLFENSILEFLSKVNHLFPILFYTPIIVLLITFGVIKGGIEILDLFMSIVVGFSFWVFLEYVLHRFMYHLEIESDSGRRFHHIIHGVHHDYPCDSRRIVTLPIVSIPLFLGIFFAFKPLATNLGIEASFLTFYAGIIIGYLFYDETHYSIHHRKIKNKFWLEVKKHHLLHHYQNSSLGFSISFPFVDKVFGTGFTQEKKDSDSIYDER